MKTEQQVPSFTTNAEAMTGEKRRNEEEHTAVPHPSSRPSSGIDQKPQTQNGNFMPTGVMPTGSIQAMPGYDALYIGDLQWVCPFAACNHIVIDNVCAPCFDSGRPMKTCVKWR